MRIARLAQSQRGRKSIGNGARDLFLHGKDIVELTIKTVRPKMIPVGGADEFRCDAQPIPGFANAPFQNMSDAEGGADLPQIRVLAFKGEGGCPTRYSQGADLGEAIE